MQRINYVLLSVVTVLLFSLTSCEAIGSIFKAGVWSGIILVAVIVVILIWVISRFRK